MTKSKYKLYYKVNGIQSYVPLFTSLNDLKNKNGNYLNIYDKSQNKLVKLYYPIGTTNDPEKTPLRIKDKNGDTYAILNTGTPEYTEQLITVPTAKAGKENVTGSFTVPAGVTRLRVSLCPACMTRKENGTEDNGESQMWAVYKFSQGTDTTFKGNGKSPKVNLSAQNNGKNSFVWGCKKGFTFEARTGSGASKTNFYSIPTFTSLSEGGQYPKNTTVKNKFYSGYIDVSPGEIFNYSIGSKSGKSEDSASCGFIVIAYGKTVEK